MHQDSRENSSMFFNIQEHTKYGKHELIKYICVHSASFVDFNLSADNMKKLLYTSVSIINERML